MLVDALSDCPTMDITDRVMRVEYLLHHKSPTILVTKECFPGERVITFYCSESRKNQLEIMARIKFIGREVDATTYIRYRGKIYLDNITNDVVTLFAKANRVSIIKLRQAIVIMSAMLMSCFSRIVHMYDTTHSLMYPRFEIIN